MASLHRISVRLSDGQKRKLMRAYQNREELTLRIAHKDLSGSDVLMVPANVVKRLQKNRNEGKGMQIKCCSFDFLVYLALLLFSDISFSYLYFIFSLRKGSWSSSRL